MLFLGHCLFKLWAEAGTKVRYDMVGLCVTVAAGPGKDTFCGIILVVVR